MKRILIADDHRDIAESLATALSSQYEVDIATTGLEALTFYLDHRHDAVVLDIEFQAGISGLEVASEIRQIDQQVPILIFSAFDYSDEELDKALNIGAIFRKKPLNPADVFRIFEGRERDE